MPIVPEPDRFRIQIPSITIIRRPFCWKYTLQHFFRISKVITAAKKQTNNSTTMAKKSVPPFSPLPTQLTHLQNKHELPLHHNLRIQHQYLLQLLHTPRPANHTFRRPIPLLPNRNLRHPPRTPHPLHRIHLPLPRLHPLHPKWRPTHPDPLIRRAENPALDASQMGSPRRGRDHRARANRAT
jgi:hypothetical protein